MSELGDKASGEERHAIETAISDLKAALEKDEKDAIETKTAALAEASAGLAQKLYAEQAKEGAEGHDGGETAQAGDDAVDAEFEEVDSDDEKKSD